MSALFWLLNLAAYCAQIAVLVGGGAALAFGLRLRAPRVALAWWQMILAGCLLLPVVQPWRGPAAAPIADISTRTTQPSRGISSRSLGLPWREAVLWTLGAGAAARALWLSLGFWRLRRYRRKAILLEPVPAPIAEMQSRLGVWPRIYRSAEIAGPVTFGPGRSAVLFPDRFFELPQNAQASIACHELIHVRRHDWLMTVGEEAVRVVLWFHPAIWWLLGRIHLAREQVVDREVIEITGARDEYLHALLAVAAGKVQPDLAPAPLFLRERHLARRVSAILKEVSMSKRRLISSLALAVVMVALAGGLAVWSFPLQAPAAPQDQSVRLESGGNLLHSAPIEYPREAKEKRIQGAVVLEISVNEQGLVSDARVLSGPEELRRAVLQSVLQWHYSKDMPLPAKLQLTIQFELADSTPGAQPTVQVQLGGPALLDPGVSFRQPATLKRISIDGLSPSARDGLMSRLPVREGDSITPDLVERVRQAVAETDEHLAMVFLPVADGLTLRIFLRTPPAPVAAPSSGPQRIRVGARVQDMMVLHKTQPVYPPLAKQARIQGIVRLNATIGADGRVQELVAESGHPLLVPAAMEAVREWVYKPTLLNGQPVEVLSQIEINFSLSQ